MLILLRCETRATCPIVELRKAHCLRCVSAVTGCRTLRYAGHSAVCGIGKTQHNSNASQELVYRKAQSTVRFPEPVLGGLRAARHAGNRTVA
jgi:hypothetical protein